MSWLKLFSAEYANGISALAAVFTFILAFTTLLFLKREYRNRYRPYVVPALEITPISGSTGFGILVIPRNVGPHPCEILIKDIKLNIGDERYETPSFESWILLGPHGIGIAMPIGHVNDLGIAKIKEARYKSNRIETAFTIDMRSTDMKFEESKLFSFEINVEGEKPVVTIRPK